MLLWKVMLAAAALKGREACTQPADARVREISMQAMSGPFAGMEATLVEMFCEPTTALYSTSENAQPGMPAKILAFMVAPSGRPVVEAK